MLHDHPEIRPNKNKDEAVFLAGPAAALLHEHYSVFTQEILRLHLGLAHNLRTHLRFTLGLRTVSFALYLMVAPEVS